MKASKIIASGYFKAGLFEALKKGYDFNRAALLIEEEQA